MNLQNNMGILAAFMLYLAAMMGIGIYYSRRQKKLSQFILGDRKLGPWVTSMSAEASDMSGWMLMGLPGFAYLNGLSAFWTGFGLIVGTWANWVLTSKRLRHYTEVANNSLTIPDYLSNRFEDHKSGLRLICALFIILFFIIYTSSGFVSAGKLFNTILGLPYFTALLIGAFVVVFYTFLGGFSAVSMTDFIQGTMMFFTVIYIPVAATIVLGGPAPTENANAERVFIIMAETLSPPFITGLIWSAVLAAIMSTASSQLLVTASAVARDLYQPFFHKNASEKELIIISRVTVLLISLCSIYLASDPNSYIFSIVSYAWAGFGACFGPVVLLSLYWRRMTLKGTYAGIIVGGITVLIWKQFNWFGLYELIPGFLFSTISIILISLMDEKPSQTILDNFNKVVSLSNEK